MFTLRIPRGWSAKSEDEGLVEATAPELIRARAASEIVLATEQVATLDRGSARQRLELAETLREFQRHANALEEFGARLEADRNPKMLESTRAITRQRRELSELLASAGLDALRSLIQGAGKSQDNRPIDRESTAHTSSADIVRKLGVPHYFAGTKAGAPLIVATASGPRGAAYLTPALGFIALVTVPALGLLALSARAGRRRTWVALCAWALAVLALPSLGMVLLPSAFLGLELVRIPWANTH